MFYLVILTLSEQSESKGKNPRILLHGHTIHYGESFRTQALAGFGSHHNQPYPGRQ